MQGLCIDWHFALIKHYILQLFTNRLLRPVGLLFNYRILSKTIQARIAQISLDFMCTFLFPAMLGFFLPFYCLGK